MTHLKTDVTPHHITLTTYVTRNHVRSTHLTNATLQLHLPPKPHNVYHNNIRHTTSTKQHSPHNIHNNIHHNIHQTTFTTQHPQQHPQQHPPQHPPHNIHHNIHQTTFTTQHPQQHPQQHPPQHPPNNIHHITSTTQHIPHNIHHNIHHTNDVTQCKVRRREEYIYGSTHTTPPIHECPWKL